MGELHRSQSFCAYAKDSHFNLCATLLAIVSRAKQAGSVVAVGDLVGNLVGLSVVRWLFASLRLCLTPLILLDSRYRASARLAFTR